MLNIKKMKKETLQEKLMELVDDLYARPIKKEAEKLPKEVFEFYKTAMQDCQIPVGDLATLSPQKYYDKYATKEPEVQPFDGEVRVNHELYSITPNGTTKRYFQDLTTIDVPLKDLDEDTVSRLKQAQEDGGVIEMEGDVGSSKFCFGDGDSIYRLQKPKTERFFRCVADYGKDGRIIRWYNQLSIDRDTETGIAKVTKLGEYEDIPIQEVE